MKVILIAKILENFSGYSIEAGIADEVRNFDHHGQFAGFSSPCNNYNIPVIGENDKTIITHIDADTLVGLLRMAGKPLPEIDLALLEQIDLNGSSVVQNKFDRTLLYAVGIGQLARQLGFPRVTNEPVDVTAIIQEMMAKTTEEIIEIGQAATEKSETAYEKCRKALSASGKVGFWSIGVQDPLDPSRPYEDGVEIVVVHRDHFKAISVYCSPGSAYGFGGQTIAGIEFAGHSKACGSPRGIEMTVEDARRVFEEIAKSI